MASADRSRLMALRRLLLEGRLSSQDELREELERLEFSVTQSTVSRDLRKIGAIRAITTEGQAVYRLPEEAPIPVARGSLRDLVSDIQHNPLMIVIHTSPGSASLVARHLDHIRPGGILGTIAGDDTIFVAPSHPKVLRQTVQAIEQCLESKA